MTDFINDLLDRRPRLAPFELRLFGPGQLNPCVLSAIKSQLVPFPRLPPKVAEKIEKKIEKRGGVVILDRNMNVDDYRSPVRHSFFKCSD